MLAICYSETVTTSSFKTTVVVFHYSYERACIFL